MSEDLVALLEALANEGRSVQAMDLTGLSDLTRSQVTMFRAAWDAWTPSRRLTLISTLVEQAETNILFNFHAILRACLHDSDPQIRKLAIEGLWEDDKVSLVQPLIGLLNDDPAADVRAAAATSLGRYMLLGVLGEIADAPARQVEAALHAVWERFDEPVAVRRRALESLAYSSDPTLYDMIHGAYYDEDELMRQSAVFAMGRSANPRWARFVLAELHNQQPAMRFESAIAAGEMGLRAAVQPLIGRLDDPDSNVREAAATALGKIGGPAARRALQALLGGQDEALAQAAEDALDELSFGSQHFEATPEEDAVEWSPRRRSGNDDEDDNEDKFDDLEDDEFGGQDDLFGDTDDELADLYEDELLGDVDLNLEDDDDEDLAEKAWDDEDDDLGWR